MKTPAIYGAYITIASALLTFALFFLGYHTDYEKFASPVQKISGFLPMVISIVGIVLGIRARRAETPAAEAFSYGKALGAGVLVGLFSALFGSIFQILYFHVVNPGMMDLTLQYQAAELQAKGLPADQVEGATKFGRMFFHPALQLGLGLLFGTLWGLIVSLVAAAFLKRPAQLDVGAPAAPLPGA